MSETKAEGIIVATPAGGYVLSAGAVVSRVHSEERFTLAVVLAHIAPDGIVTQRRHLGSYPDRQSPPDERWFSGLAQHFISTRQPPETFAGISLDWQRATTSNEIRNMLDSNLAMYGINETPFSEMLTWRMQQIQERLKATPGTLPNLIARHHPNIAHPLSRLSTMNLWAKEQILARPWMNDTWLGNWHKDLAMDIVPDVGTMAAILSGQRKGTGLGITGTAVRWCDRFFAENPIDAPSFEYLGILSALPLSWWPDNGDDYLALNAISTELLFLCDGDPLEAVDMLRPSKGRFADYIDAMSPQVSDSRSTTIRDIADAGDFVRAIHRDLVAPFLGEEGVMDNRAARAIVSKGGGLRRYLDASRSWHAIPHLKGRLTTEDHVWPACVEPYAHDGLEIVELLSAIDLWREGSRMSHCVGGDDYVVKCMTGTSRILSIRENGMPLSTVEIVTYPSLDAMFSVIQHRGPGNTIPPARAISALEAWSRAVTHGRHFLAPAHPVPLPESSEVDLPGEGPAAWRRHIRRNLASMTWSEFGAEVRKMAGVPEPIEENTHGNFRP